jgi:hypothetical protein
MVIITLININMIAFLIKYLIACGVHPIMVNVTSKSHDELVHAILTKLTFACGMFTSYWEYTMELGWIINFVIICVILRLKGKLVINFIFYLSLFCHYCFIINFQQL